MSGIYKELQKHFGSSVQNYIVAARTAQGYDELAASTQEERIDVVKRWQAAQLELHKEKQQVKDNASHPPECVFLRTKHAVQSSFEEKRKHARDGKLHKDPAHAKHGSPARKPSEGRQDAFQHLRSGQSLEHADTATFEDAIQQSVQATSRGDPEEDAMIERAIRASVEELRAATKKGDGMEAMQKAIKASVAEAAQARRTMSASKESATPSSDDDLHLALQRSLSLHPATEDHQGYESNHSGAETAPTGNEKDSKPAVEQSHATQIPPDDDNDSQLQKAIEESRFAHDQHTKGLERERTEEEIVLEYVKKQSLLEEEHRRSLASRDSTAAAVSDKDGG